MSEDLTIVTLVDLCSWVFGFRWWLYEVVMIPMCFLCVEGFSFIVMFSFVARHEADEFEVVLLVILSPSFVLSKGLYVIRQLILPSSF